MTSIKLAHYLCLAAAPVFAGLALFSALGGGAYAMLCSGGRGPLALDGMPVMYIAMAIFHLPPWLRLLHKRSARNSRGIPGHARNRARVRRDYSG